MPLIGVAGFGPDGGEIECMKLLRAQSRPGKAARRYGMQSKCLKKLDAFD
jgi:hypothetical protein